MELISKRIFGQYYRVFYLPILRRIKGFRSQRYRKSVVLRGLKKIKKDILLHKRRWLQFRQMHWLIFRMRVVKIIIYIVLTILSTSIEWFWFYQDYKIRQDPNLYFSLHYMHIWHNLWKSAKYFWIKGQKKGSAK